MFPASPVLPSFYPK
jgi:hypothetical protein